jgi:predicted TIM-barrel fold metal-dependent hydrolase
LTELQKNLPECIPHDPHPKKPRKVPPALACDVHAHVCGPRDIFPLVDNRLYNPPEASAAEYIGMLDTLGLARGVLVQPSVYGTDNRAMLEALAAYPDRLRGVAVLPFDVPMTEIERLHALGVRGVRCNIVDLQTGKGQLPVAGLKQLADKIKPLGWHIEFLMHVNEFPDLDVQFASLDVPLVFGHLGYVPTHIGQSEGFEALLRMAKQGKAFIKLTAPYRLTPEAYPYPTTNAAAQRLMDEVPHCLMWGSDWPHVFIKSAMPNDGDLYNLFLDWVKDESLLKTILVDNPANIYF